MSYRGSLGRTLLVVTVSMNPLDNLLVVTVSVIPLDDLLVVLVKTVSMVPLDDMLVVTISLIPLDKLFSWRDFLMTCWSWWFQCFYWMTLRPAAHISSRPSKTALEISEDVENVWLPLFVNQNSLLCLIFANRKDWKLAAQRQKCHPTAELGLEVENSVNKSSFLEWLHWRFEIKYCQCHMFEFEILFGSNLFGHCCCLGICRDTGLILISLVLCVVQSWVFITLWFCELSISELMLFR